MAKCADEVLDSVVAGERPTPRRQDTRLFDASVDWRRPLTPAMMLHLQRTVGNRAVAALLSNRDCMSPTTLVQRRCHCQGVCSCGKGRTDVAPDSENGHDAARERIAPSGARTIQRWQWPWEEEKTDQGDAEAWGTPGQESDPLDGGGGTGSSGGARLQRWFWPWETSDATSGGGQSGGGGASDSWEPADAGPPGGMPYEPPTALDEGPPEEENACYEPPNYSPADRSWTCKVSCNVDIIKEGAKCPATVPGAGSGASVKAACTAAKADANSKIPDGCKKRHCHGQCKGSQGSKGECR
jgi:hypothetical protein